MFCRNHSPANLKEQSLWLGKSKRLAPKTSRFQTVTIALQRSFGGGFSLCGPTVRCRLMWQMATSRHWSSEPRCRRTGCHSCNRQRPDDNANRHSGSEFQSADPCPARKLKICIAAFSGVLDPSNPAGKSVGPREPLRNRRSWPMAPLSSQNGTLSMPDLAVDIGPNHLKGQIDLGSGGKAKRRDFLRISGH